jgi:DNA polymerase elongation subunit (family B)
MKREELIKKAEEFVKKVNKKLPGIIELEFRDLYEGGIFVAREKGETGAKKRYALVDYQGNLEVRGFETVRRDWCQLAKDIQRKVLITVLKEKDPIKAIELVRETIKKIKEGKVSLDELTIYEQITRPLSQYEQIGPHVKAAKKALSRGLPIGEGSVIGFVIVKGTGSISDRAEPVEFVKPNQYDSEYYIHHQILPASMRVLKALGYSEQEVLSGKIQKKLEGFFKK